MRSYYDFEKARMDGRIVRAKILNIGGSISGYWNQGLYEACKSGNLKNIELMTRLTAKLTPEHNDWNDGLRGACEGGHLSAINLMIERGANDWNWGLHGACENGHLNVAYLMIEHGANDWNLGLDGACRGGYSNIVKLMLRRGAHVHNFIRLDCLFNVIDSDIIDLIIENKIHIRDYLEYPKDRLKIFELYELGLPISNFKYIHGFDNFVNDINERQTLIKHILDIHLIKDLTRVINGYVMI